MVWNFLYTKDAVQQNAQVARAFMTKPMMPVVLIKMSSKNETATAMMAAAVGPKVKPPIQTMTSLKSKSRNMTLGIILEASITM